MSPTQKHLLHFEGGNALSAFRAQALLPKLQSVSSRITGVAARHVHWVWTDTEVQPDATRKLASLLRYGDAYAGPTAERRRHRAGGGDAAPGHRLAVGQQGHRHRPQLRPGAAPRRARHRVPPDASRRACWAASRRCPSDELQAAAMLLHDRMTESVAFEREAAVHLFDKQPAEPLVHVDLLGQGRDALVRGQRASSAWRCPTTRSTTSSTPSRAWSATRPTSS